MKNDFVSRLIDRTTVEAMKQMIAELAMEDLESRFGEANPEAILNKLADKIHERSDRRLLGDVKEFLAKALAAGDKEKVDWCMNAIAELTRLPGVDSYSDEAAKKPKGRT